MRVPLSWLKDYVDWPWEPGELAERLTMAGVKIEKLVRLGDGLRGVVAARVVSVRPHPGAPAEAEGEGGLWLVDVTTGLEPHRVVAGIANMGVGDIVAYAPPGSALPGGWEIGVARLRGVDSEGMLLSLSELALGEKPREGEGILVLPPDVAPGTDIAAYMGLPEPLLELDLTPNYAAHCQSIVGVAREVAALTGAGPAGVRRPDPTAGAVPAGEPAAATVRVTIQKPERCPRYVARVVRRVSQGPSPWWMQLRIVGAGMRPINSIVDITNYVMLEYGQPLHAFDLAEVAGRHIIVRCAEPGEEMVTLDGVTRRLEPDLLVIADADRAVALAGVMGGLTSEVGPKTRDILLESAHFDARTVRRAATRLALPSEAAARFDKGADPGVVDEASLRAATLIAGLAGGVLAPGSVDAHPVPLRPREACLRTDRASVLMGVDVTPAEAAGHLARLGFMVEVDAVGDNILRVTIPTWRSDVAGEADLIEEVARMYGYDRVPAALPYSVTTVGGRSATWRLADRARRAMAALGFAETVSMSLVDPETAGRLTPVESAPLALANPLAANQSVLRTGLLGGLVEAAVRNLRRAERSVRLFELGPVYWPRREELSPTALPDERTHLSAVAVGAMPEGLGPTAGWKPDFFYLKGVAGTLLRELGVEGYEVRRTDDVRFHPGRQAGLRAEGPDGTTVELGVIGEVHPQAAAEYGLEEAGLALEVDLGAILTVSTASLRFEPLPRFPAVTRDVAVVLPEEVEAADIRSVIKRTAGDLCAAVTLFDLYRGHPVPEGHRSSAWRVVYRSPERSLTDTEVDGIHARVRGALERELGATLR